MTTRTDDYLYGNPVIEQVTSWKTADGVHHDSFGAAQAHDDILQTERRINQWLFKNDPGPRNLAKALVRDWIITPRLTAGGGST
jgi:hypothetical protein